MEGLLELAKKKKLKVRNLVDGFPVPPMRQTERKSRGYRGDKDASWAVIGRLGYIQQDGSTMSCSMFLPNSRKTKMCVKEAERLGASIKQQGDTELSFTFPQNRFVAVSKMIAAFKEKIK